MRQLAKIKDMYVSNEVKLKINIDGIPLFKSSNASLWPILCSFHKLKPFVVCLYYGLKKPSPIIDYLSDFKQELSHLLTAGVNLGTKNIKVSVLGIICDAPARQYLKCIKSHTGYYCCERCEIKGHRSNNQIVYYTPTLQALRTDDKFNNLDYKKIEGSNIEGHQISMSPLIGLVPCVSRFPLDYMHLVCLGVMRRMVYFWKKGSKISPKCKLSNASFNQISENLCLHANEMPREFARKPRGLIHFEKWKATEFRQFLLYTGPVVLRNVLDKNSFKHFLSLSISMSVLLQDNSEMRNSYLGYVKSLLEFFVKESKKIYTELFISYNVHNLLHLASDCETFNCSLNDISAFEFENCLQFLKRKVRSGKNPIAQIAARVIEANANFQEKCNPSIKPKMCSKSPNNCFLISGEKYVFIQNVQEDGTFICSVVPSDNCENFYPEPFNSKLINVCFCKQSTVQRAKLKILDKSKFLRKVVCLSYKDGFVMYPMLHNCEK